MAVDNVADDGHVYQRRLYNEKCIAEKDFDTNDYNQPKAHSTGAHKHTFQGKKRSTPQSLAEEELEKTAILSKEGLIIMTRDEWIKRVKYGTDIVFTVRGKCFTIFNWDQFIIGEAYTEEDKKYDTAEELVDNFMVNGKSLGELADEIVIEQYTLAGDYEHLL